MTIDRFTRQATSAYIVVYGNDSGELLATYWDTLTEANTEADTIRAMASRIGFDSGVRVDVLADIDDVDDVDDWDDVNGGSLVSRNMLHLLSFHAPLTMTRDGSVVIDYGYNSGGCENHVYFVTADGGALAIDTVIAEIANVNFTDRFDPQWRVFASEVNWEDTELVDDHTGSAIPSVYGE